MKRLTSINPCPIVEAVVELRFVPNYPSDAIFGVIFQAFKTEFPGQRNLPILQLPEVVRNNDVNLIYKPHHQLFNKDFILQIGPKTISLVCNYKETKWGEYSQKLKETFERIKKLDVIIKPERIGIRYINFFPHEMLNNLNLSITVNQAALNAEEINLRYTINTGNFLSTLNFFNKAEILKDGKMAKGSVLDIDTFSQELQGDFLAKIDSHLEDAHTEEKKLFCTLLKPEFLATLNPVYEE